MQSSSDVERKRVSDDKGEDLRRSERVQNVTINAVQYYHCRGQH
jgi:hypothetical protein